MSDVMWPPADKVKYMGFLSSVDVWWMVAAIAVGMLGVVTQHVLLSAPAALAIAVFGRAQLGGVRVRTRCRLRLGWLTRGDKQWSAPLKGEAGVPRMLRGVTLEAHPEEGRMVGVVRTSRRITLGWGSTSTFTVMLPVTCASVTFLDDAARDRRFGLWGDVLGSQCVEKGSSLVAERIAWTDIHRAANPHALKADHARFGVPGPATADYDEYVDGFGSVAADHHIVVSVTVSTGQVAVARTEAGLSGSNDEVMIKAAMSVGRSIRSRLEASGFRCGEFYRPSDVGRLIVEAGDPFATRSNTLTAKERFGLPERVGPDSVEVSRTHLAIDGSYHRCFQLVWPRTRVQPQWLWRVLAVEGPKLVTTVFETVPPSRADVDRDARAARQRSNSAIVAGRRGGDESTADGRKRAALKADEQAVAAGHEELDCYSIIVISARTPAELTRRCERLREALRESGKANVRELAGLHDTGFRLALPLGDQVPNTKE